MSENPSEPVEYGPHIRYKSCLIFESTGVPYVVWVQDALRHYGVPTALFDLYIQVWNLDIAANALIEAGWVLDTVSSRRIGNTIVEIPQKPLISPDNRTRTVLLLASDWKFPLATNPPIERIHLADKLPRTHFSFPTLPALLGALIESYLAGPTELLIQLSV
jgi:hypothetical protein